ncbi:hypothetical protein AYI68_g4952 [Smittium mucronatum]|uniref:Uncharacterized protein n=1 Tax=Smittium mucronatum TaxID=133383 RepID=A0A1R0GVK6_9FUNG|nr:hypothetical protein AYI68_g4952 [Smittium mucronatum]
MRWWICQNPWLTNSPVMSEKISKIWKKSMEINTVIDLNVHPDMLNPDEYRMIPEFKFPDTVNENGNLIKKTESKTSQPSSDLSKQRQSSEEINLDSELQSLKPYSTKETSSQVSDGQIYPKKKSFFNSNRVKMARRMVGDAIKAAETHFGDQTSTSPEVLEVIEEEDIEAKSFSDYIDKYITNPSNDTNISFKNENIFDPTDASQRSVFNLYRTIIEFSNFLNQLYLGYSLDCTWPSPDPRSSGLFNDPKYNKLNEISNYSYGQTPPKTEYYYYKESSTLFRVIKLDNNEYSIEVHSPFGSHPYTVKVPELSSEDSYLSSIYENDFVNILQKSAMFDNSNSSRDNFSIKSPGIEGNTSHLHFKYGLSNDSLSSELETEKKFISSPIVSPTFHPEKKFPHQNNTINGTLQFDKEKSPNMEDYLNSLDQKYLSEVQFLGDFISKTSEKLNLSNKSSTPNDFQSIGKDLVLEQQGKMNLYRLPIFLANQKAYKVKLDLESSFMIDDIKTLAPTLDINVGIQLIDLQKTKDEDPPSVYVELCKNLSRLSIDSINASYKVGERVFSLPRSLGYKIKYFPAEQTSALGSNQFIFYSKNDGHQSMDLLHFILRLQNEAITGINSLDLYFEGFKDSSKTHSKFDLDSNSIATTASFSINNLWNGNFNNDLDHVERAYPLWVFYIISPIESVGDSLVHIKKIIYSSNQSDSDYVFSVNTFKYWFGISDIEF